MKIILLITLCSFIESQNNTNNIAPPRRQCFAPCDHSNYDPVCSVEGNTYTNMCVLTCESNDTFLRKGTCYPVGGGSGNDCNCPNGGKQVCGKDKKTYRNRCVLECNRAKFDYSGKCDDGFFKWDFNRPKINWPDVDINWPSWDWDFSRGN